MKKTNLQTIYLQGLHHAEFGQFIARFFEDFNRSGLNKEEDSDFNELFENLKSQLPTYNKAMEQIHASQESKNIAALDKIRDADFQALKDSIKPYKKGKTETIIKAYNAIKLVLDQQKGLRRFSYEAQTNRINTLISVLETEEYQSFANTLRISNFISELKKSNQEFDKLFAKRSYDKLQKETYNAKELRKQLTDNYRKMVNYIDVLAQVKQGEFYPKVLDVINNSRKYYSDMISIRTGRKIEQSHKQSGKNI